MSVVRIDINKCIGCENCVNICPMDVFYFDRTAHKSVMRYPENCQSCGQCYMNCKGRSLGMTNDIFGYPLVSTRGLSESEMNRIVVTENGTFGEISKGMLP